jgi:uncharacterized OB-fold protein
VPALVPQPEGIPLPQPNHLSQPFWDACGRGELLFQRCQKCRQAIFNPAPICRFCGSPDLRWERSAGAGEIYSWTVVWRPQAPTFRVPYAPIIVSLDEGYQMVSSLVGCDSGEVRSGLRVAVEFHPIGGGFELPYFRPRA